MFFGVRRSAQQGMVVRISERLFGQDLDGLPVSEQQVGAIPYAVVEGEPVFLLITSRGSGRWIFPKGGLIDGLTATETAAAEAREEAGVEGDLLNQPIGTYRDWKIRGLKRHVIEVEMYPLRVTRQLDEWPEQHERSRHWATLKEAKRLLPSNGLVELATRLHGSAAQAPVTNAIIR